MGSSRTTESILKDPIRFLNKMLLKSAKTRRLFCHIVDSKDFFAPIENNNRFLR